jgi:hypothetical protein
VVEPDGTFNLSGRTVENGTGVAGVTVAVASGIGLGTHAITDAIGAHTLYGVAVMIELRLSREGYFTVMQDVVVTELNTRAPDVTVTPTIAPADFSGHWRLTIAPSAGCAAAIAAVAPRTLDLTITQAGASPSLVFAAGDMFTRSPMRASSAHITGTVLEFTLSTTVDGYYKFYSSNLLYDVMEALDGDRFLGFSGDARVDGSTTPASGVFGGSVDLFAGNAN